MTQILEFAEPEVKIEKDFNLTRETESLAITLIGVTDKTVISELLINFLYDFENYLQKILLDKKIFFDGKNNVTDEDVFNYLMLSVKTKMKLIKRLTNLTPFKSWMEVERKMRLLLNDFSNDLDGSKENPHNPHTLFEISALAFLGMIQFGKWSNDSNA